MSHTHVQNKASKDSIIFTSNFLYREEMITILPFSELQRSVDALGGDRADAAGCVPGRCPERRRFQRTTSLTVSTL